MNDSKLAWKCLKRELIHDLRIFQLNRTHCLSPSGDTVPFIQIDAPDWVTIIPELPVEDDTQEFLVIRQYRHGNERICMEFPAGTLDTGEKPLEAAARELLEETGYKATELVKIGSVSPNPAFMSNKTHTFLARKLEKILDQNLDPHEYLDVHKATYSQIQKSMGNNEYNSAITVQAWYMYLKHTGRL